MPGKIYIGRLNKDKIKVVIPKNPEIIKGIKRIKGYFWNYKERY